MKNRKHICLDPAMQELVEQWAVEGDRSFSAQITRLIKQEDARCQTSDSGTEARAA